MSRTQMSKWTGSPDSTHPLYQFLIFSIMGITLFDFLPDLILCVPIPLFFIQAIRSLSL